jgi:hypothetical protein
VRSGPGRLPEARCWPEVVPQRRGWQAGPDDHEVSVLQGRAGGQVAGGRVHRDQPLRPVQKSAPARTASSTRPAPSTVRPLIQVAARRRWAGAAAGGWGFSLDRVDAPWGDGAASAEDA